MYNLVHCLAHCRKLYILQQISEVGGMLDTISSDKKIIKLRFTFFCLFENLSKFCRISIKLGVLNYCKHDSVELLDISNRLTKNICDYDFQLLLQHL